MPSIGQKLKSSAVNIFIYVKLGSGTKSPESNNENRNVVHKMFALLIFAPFGNVFSYREVTSDGEGDANLNQCLTLVADEL